MIGRWWAVATLFTVGGIALLSGCEPGWDFFRRAVAEETSWRKQAVKTAGSLLANSPPVAVS
jgi:hypothetical protein